MDGKVTQGDSFQSFFLHKLAQLSRRITPQWSRSRKFAHLGTYRSQALSQTVSPSFQGKGCALYSRQWRLPRQRWRGFLLDPLPRPHCAPRPRLDGLPGEASVRGTGQRGRTGSQTRRPGLGYLLQPGPPDVCFANCSQMRHWGQLSPAVPETQQPKAKFCTGEGLQVCTGLLVSFQQERSHPSFPRPPPPPFPPQSQSTVAWPFEEGESKGFLPTGRQDGR